MAEYLVITRPMLHRQYHGACDPLCPYLVSNPMPESFKLDVLCHTQAAGRAVVQTGGISNDVFEAM